MTHPEAVRRLMDEAQRDVLGLFITQPRSVGQVAALTGLALKRVHYLATRFVALGLLEVVDEQARKGRAVKRYQSTAPSFYIPFAALPTADLLEHAQARDATFNAQLLHHLTRASEPLMTNLNGWGRRVVLENGKLELWTAREVSGPPDDPATYLAADDKPALWSSWDTLALDLEDAKALQRVLIRLSQRYGQKQGGRTYLLRLALTPAADE